MVRYLITGGGGFIGRKFGTLFRQNNDVVCTYNSNPQPDGVQLDIRDGNRTIATIRDIKPDVIVHTVAYSNADKCEANPELARQINVEGTRHIAEAASLTNAVMVYTSSAYIFDGERGNYSEADTPNPVNVLGQTKLLGETEIRSLLKKWIILRFAISYGYNGKGRNNAFLGDILEGRYLKVNNDQIRQPLFIDDIVDIVACLLDQEAVGTFHIAGPEEMTKYQLGIALERLVRTDSRLTPVLTREEPHKAKRPFYGTLDASKLKKMGIPVKSVDESLKILVDQIAHS